MTLACPYCARPAEIVSGADLYPHRPELHAKKFWRCQPCQAWVGCHPGTENPLGRLADAKLRRAKSQAHAAFDPMWKEKMRRDGVRQNKARRAGYKWLAAQLGIAIDDCHIGMFDVATCWRVVEACRPYQRHPGREAAE